MSDKFIIDRRKNPKGKSLSNRQRFIRRVKEHLRERVKKNIVKRSISDQGSEDISIPIDDISEPSFGYDQETGDYDIILPGNKKFLPGDKLPKPPDSGAGDAGEGSPDGEGEDEFTFTLTRDEYLDVVFEGLELPNMDTKNKNQLEKFERVRAGYSKSGNPSQLDIVRSMGNSLGRRLALGKQKNKKRIKELEAKDELTDSDIEELARLKRKLKAVPFIDPIDMRYRAYTKEPKPITSAVMICIMDVSASMGENEKELAKRFFLLLYLFLERKYKDVAVCFVRHHSEAKECDEDEFFNSQETGGTVVSTGFEVAKNIINSRYSPDNWNIYIAQASDGDNFGHDMVLLEQILTGSILPIVKYMTYIELSRIRRAMSETTRRMIGYDSEMWDLYNELAKQWPNIVNHQISDSDEIISVFREMFGGEK